MLPRDRTKNHNFDPDEAWVSLCCEIHVLGFNVCRGWILGVSLELRV